jgi:glycosyltransferase involved in cell wall biosynthesis
MASTLIRHNFKVAILEWDRGSNLATSGYEDGIRIWRMKLKAPYGIRLMFKLPVWWLYVFFYLIFHNFEVIQPQNLDNLIPALIISRMRRIKIVYDIADFYADAFIPFQMIALRKVTAKLERLLIKAVSAIILVDESRLTQVNALQKYFRIIYNSPSDKYLELRAKLGKNKIINSTFAIFYAGILAKDRCLDLLISTISEIDNVSLVIAGFGSMENEIRKMVRGKRNIKFLGRISHMGVLQLTYLSNCIVALYDPFFPNNVFASPNKLFEAMMCRKPIIVSEGTAMAKIVYKEQCGIVIKYNDSEELKSTVEKLKKDSNYSRLLGKNGRVAYLRKYSWNLMETRLSDLYTLI